MPSASRASTCAAATRNRGEVFSRRIQAWRTTGYLRGLLKALFPRLCKQTDYFKSIDFRLGREVGKKEAEQTAEKVEKAERANASNEKAGASSSTVRNPMMDNNVAATTSMQGRQQP